MRITTCDWAIGHRAEYYVSRPGGRAVRSGLIARVYDATIVIIRDDGWPDSVRKADLIRVLPKRS